MDLDLRRLPEAKGELLLRTEELRDSLWEVCDDKLAENQAELEAVMATSWVQDRTLLLAQVRFKIIILSSQKGGTKSADSRCCAHENRGTPLGIRLSPPASVTTSLNQDRLLFVPTFARTVIRRAILIISAPNCEPGAKITVGFMGRIDKATKVWAEVKCEIGIGSTSQSWRS